MHPERNGYFARLFLHMQKQTFFVHGKAGYFTATRHAWRYGQKGVFMAQINVKNVTFAYPGGFDNIFENVSFHIDTDWKLGLIGRNGKGKTTFLNLLLDKYEYSGTISTDTVFDYFPYELTQEEMGKSAAELMEKWKPGVENWRVLCELPALKLDAELLYRQIGTLSFGERTKIILAVLFSGENDFLLIDEPTNHLDGEAREIIKEYLAGKKGFILVSHDRDLLDACIDHVLVLNRATIEVQSGNFSTWWENKEKADAFARMENEKHKKEINKLRTAADRTLRWAQKNENTKIGYDPVREPDRMIDTRAYIGAKTKKAQARVKAMEMRIDREIEKKEGLLRDMEEVVDLKIRPLEYYKERLILCRDFSMQYKDSTCPVIRGLNFELNSGERVFINGKNGCGKSSLIKAILNSTETENYVTDGTLSVAGNLVISYVNQGTSQLHGNLKTYAAEHNLEYSLFLSLLRQLDMERTQFHKNIQDFSEGQKKKVLIAASLLTPAHLYIWDEPLNYIDIFSRMQIEKLVKTYRPTMLVVEHDVRFREMLATKTIEM